MNDSDVDPRTLEPLGMDSVDELPMSMRDIEDWTLLELWDVLCAYKYEVACGIGAGIVLILAINAMVLL